MMLRVSMADLRSRSRVSSRCQCRKIAAQGPAAAGVVNGDVDVAAATNVG